MGLQAFWAGQYGLRSFFPSQYFLILSYLTFPSNRSDTRINVGNIGLIDSDFGFGICAFGTTFVKHEKIANRYQPRNSFSLPND